MDYSCSVERRLISAAKQGQQKDTTVVQAGKQIVRKKAQNR